MNENMMNRSYRSSGRGRLTGTLHGKDFGWDVCGLWLPLLLQVGFAMTGTIFYIYSFVTASGTSGRRAGSGDISLRQD